MSNLDRLLSHASQGGAALSAELLPLVYDELRHLAARRLSGNRAVTLQATELVHEAWVKLSSADLPLWNDRAHFFRAAALAMRRIIVDRAREKAALKRGQGQVPLDLSTLDIAAVTPDERVLMVDDALTRLEKESPESARLITLKFFGGLTNEELADSEGVAERTIRRRWDFAKARLYHLLSETPPPAP
ncbi:ECF-type sigma factor [Roseibacillus ishigakijimensis]|uniref:Sigma-70 family RNA polymerase sigma factor n=1 Tax=Roseibacillus ishigakijimensis TaxID=454146 RepID=A0A934RSF5_9BACT|nr:ECF-type sigma factor [Roseibacillus ishigakijimensis]MBK1834806.1 sigma-70 family RNA polymerase sigma factor [Roseibacillus ishigakijimensis]